MAHAGDFRRVTVECSKPAGREASIAWRVPTLAFSPAGSRGPVVEAQAEEAHLCASLNNRECLAYLLLPRPHWVLSLKKSSKTEKRPAGGGGHLLGHTPLRPRAGHRRMETPSGLGGRCWVLHTPRGLR